MGASVYIHYTTTIMESLPSVSPSMFIVLPSNNSPLQLLRMKTQQRSQLRSRCPRISVYPLSAAPLFIEPSSSSSSNGSASRRRLPRETSASCRACSGGSAREEDAEEEEDLERALHMDGRIPRSSDQFVKKVSSRAYDMRRHLQQSMDCSSYDGTFLSSSSSSSSSPFDRLRANQLVESTLVIDLGQPPQTRVKSDSIVVI